jgi:signal transduction histidine kinase
MSTHTHDRAKVVAHEMRSPLAAISNALEVLKLGGADPCVVDDMRGRIARQLHQLIRLVDDLVDEQQLAQEHFELRKERIDLVSVMRCAIETTRPLIERFGHSLTTAFPPTALIVEGDADRLTQVFVNLLENAARYTEPRGRIVLSVEHIRAGAMVRVQDDGTGIASELLPHVFEMYVRGDSQARSRTGGMGIGLAVARKVVEAHGGTISASSDGTGKGSVFLVQLPASESDDSL